MSQSSSVVELKETPPPLDIPKELFRLVDRIKRYGLETVREKRKERNVPYW